MSEEWIHAMHGVPWTPKKMKSAVEKLRRRATISFAFDSDKLADLVKLDEMVLSHRPDLILHIWSYRKKGDYSDEMLDILAGLKNMKSLIEIDVLKTASKLEILELNEINTKIKAEAFDFLLDMSKLKQLDFQYIDFNKKRIEIMQKKWIDSGKQDVIIDCIPREKRQKKMNSIHLTRILM
ncbi:hypothetical protein [Paenibacillus sp. KN14-4R]|uniref:hypothetical protein n=1 Tax=Paenibacillus sp. KN14-4R TaxID=3445773 RepID=UPI003FA02615